MGRARWCQRESVVVTGYGEPDEVSDHHSRGRQSAPSAGWSRRLWMMAKRSGELQVFEDLRESRMAATAYRWGSCTHDRRIRRREGSSGRTRPEEGEAPWR